MDPRAIQQRVLAAMTAGITYTVADLARKTWLGTGVTSSALVALWQAGKVTTGDGAQTYKLV